MHCSAGVPDPLSDFDEEPNVDGSNQGSTQVGAHTDVHQHELAQETCR